MGKVATAFAVSPKRFPSAGKSAFCQGANSAAESTIRLVALPPAAIVDLCEELEFPHTPPISVPRFRTAPHALMADGRRRDRRSLPVPQPSNRSTADADVENPDV